MKEFAVVVLAVLTASFLRAADAPSTQPALKIACVGDSITYGSGTKDPKSDSYPAQLQKLLGEKYLVSNFGVGGATMLKKGNKPYWKEENFDDAKEVAPDIVVIKLGTNDSKPENWKFKDEFKANLTEMVDQFAALPSHPTIWLCHPVPAFPGNWGIRDQVIHEEIIPMIDAVSKEKKLKVIDLYAALSGKPELFPDTVHPNNAGARLIALEVFRSLTGKPYPADRTADHTAATAPAHAK
jgi:acyl-CoA thioesterase-1